MTNEELEKVISYATIPQMIRVVYWWHFSYKKYRILEMSIEIDGMSWRAAYNKAKNSTKKKDVNENRILYFFKKRKQIFFI